MRVLIVARDATAAEAIRRALRYAPTCRVMGWVDGRHAWPEPVGAADPDVVVLDECASSETTQTRAGEIRAALPEAKLVLLAGVAHAAALADAGAAGVDAVISKTASAASIAMLVREIAAGNVFHLRPAAPPPAGVPDAAGVLTGRELEILRHVAAGLPNGRIATELWVTEQTVKFHLTNVYRKLGLGNRTEAARYAYRNGLADAGGPLAPVPTTVAA